MQRRQLVQGLFAGGTLAALGGCSSMGGAPSSAKVVVVGGGYGGATAARYVRLFSDRSLDVVLVRHVLWAVPDPDAALAAWVGLLAPSGRLILVEGHWHTGGGLRAETTRSLVLRHRQEAEVTMLTDEALWGGPVNDERYLLVSRR